MYTIHFNSSPTSVLPPSPPIYYLHSHVPVFFVTWSRTQAVWDHEVEIIHWGLLNSPVGIERKKNDFASPWVPGEPIVSERRSGTLWAPSPSRTLCMTFLFVSRMISWRPLINGIPFCCINRGYWWLERLRIQAQKVGIGCKEIISEPHRSRQLCLAK